MTSAVLRRHEDEAPRLRRAPPARLDRPAGRKRLSIPDQRRQIEGYGLARGWEVAAEFVEPGNTAIDDRQPRSRR